ncbi:hypothetical protein RB195_004207 [Necator americanus]|uniref:Secreted protein n=1 Tax=Necator americanus TaxID=51031 RepID=A0ABR1BGV1_NECAM
MLMVASVTMNPAHFFFVLLLAISQRCFAMYPYGGYYGPMAGVPIVHAAPALPHPIAFSNGPIYTSITPSIHPIYHTPRLELRNIIRTGSKDTAHFADTMHRSLGMPFHKKRNY